MSDGAWVYILRCSDGSFYTGTARAGLDKRVSEHNSGHYGYTASRRPVTLVFSQWSDRIVDAIAAERQIKGWSRRKLRRRLSPAISKNCARSRSGGLRIRQSARRRIPRMKDRSHRD
jgi:putative endonuclease